MSKKGSAEISQSVEESNKLREQLGIQKLRTEDTKSKEGTSNAPVHAPAPGKSDEGNRCNNPHRSGLQRHRSRRSSRLGADVDRVGAAGQLSRALLFGLFRQLLGHRSSTV